MISKRRKKDKTERVRYDQAEKQEIRKLSQKGVQQAMFIWRRV